MKVMDVVGMEIISNNNVYPSLSAQLWAWE